MKRAPRRRSNARSFRPGLFGFRFALGFGLGIGFGDGLGVVLDSVLRLFGGLCCGLPLDGLGLGVGSGIRTGSALLTVSAACSDSIGRGYRPPPLPLAAARPLPHS